MTAHMPGQSHRHPARQPRLREQVQLVDATEGLDEFAPEQEEGRSLLRIEPAIPPAPRASVGLGGADTNVDRTYLPTFDWTRYANRSALATSVLIVGATVTLLLQLLPTTPPAGNSFEPTFETAPPTLVDASPVVEAPVVEAPALSEAVSPPQIDLSPPPTMRPPDPERKALSRVTTAAAPLADRATTRVLPSRMPPPRDLVTLEAPVDAPAASNETRTAAARSSSIELAEAVAPEAASPVSPPAVSRPTETPSSVSPDLPMSPATRATSRDLDARAIETVLGRYQNAFNTLDAGAAAAVWPTVNERTLARAFERLDHQAVAFESCNIEVAEARAEAACSGTAGYVPKVGSRTLKAEARRWTFMLRRAGDSWLIDRIDTR